MTTFASGPAVGETLMLRRCPIFLRVVINSEGKVDALDRSDDVPEIDEKLYAYCLTEKPMMSHLNFGGGRGGFYPVSTYALVEPQPADAVMRDRLKWVEWVMGQAVAEHVK
jgi:hypothetical protein